MNVILGHLSPLISAKTYLRIKYKLNNGVWLNIDNPSTFNEKMNWLKLYHHSSLLTQMADKFEVKTLVAEKIGDEYVVPCYGVWDKVDEIDFTGLTLPCVIKTTHDSSGVVVVKKINDQIINSTKIKIKKALTGAHYYANREWPYKNIKRRVIADKFLDDGRQGELQDYKFWCFNGEPKVMYITNKGKNIYENFYDMDFNVINVNHGFPRMIPEYKKPDAFNLMKDLAKKLSSGIPFVRVDFFYVQGKVYFGEYTFFDWGGMRAFESPEWDKTLGDWIDLSPLSTRKNQ